MPEPVCGPRLTESIAQRDQSNQLAAGTEFVQGEAVELRPAVPAPPGEAPVARGSAQAEHRRALSPGAARRGREDDRGQRLDRGAPAKSSTTLRKGVIVYLERRGSPQARWSLRASGRVRDARIGTDRQRRTRYDTVYPF